MATELFYVIADAACAEARKAVLASGKKERIDFRNLHYENVARDFADRGGQTVPALWDGVTLHQGLPAVLAALAVV